MVNGKAFCFAGKRTWQELVCSGEVRPLAPQTWRRLHRRQSERSERAAQVSGDAARPVKASAFRFILELFELAGTAQLDEKERARLRPLLACWYYTASECNFDDDEDDEENEEEEVDQEEENEESQQAAERAISSLLPALLSAPAQQRGAAADEEDDEDDGDYVPPADEEQEVWEDMDEGAAADAEGEKKDAQGKRKCVSFAAPEPAQSSNAPVPPQQAEAAAEGEEDDDGEWEDVDDMEEDEGADMEDDEAEVEEGAGVVAAAAESAEAKAQRKRLLAVVDRFGCYLPDPTSHPTFFRAMLRRFNSGDPEAAFWFPWHPVRKLAEATQRGAAEDPPLQAYALSILRQMGVPGAQ